MESLLTNSIFGQLSAPTMLLKQRNKKEQIFLTYFPAFQPNVRVLNYAPGPLSTDMYDEICRTCGDEKIAGMFNASKEEVSVTTGILEIFACRIWNLGL